MHPFRYAMTRGPMIFRAPEDDSGFDPDLEADDTFQDEDPPEDDEAPEDELEVDELDEEPEAPEPQPQRAQRQSFAQRVETVAQRKAAETEARLRQEFEARIAQMNQQPRETPQQLQERLSMMDPLDRLEYQRQSDFNAMTARLQQIEFNSQDSADRTAFEALASRTPAAAKLRTEVEARLADMRRTGVTAPRETILKYLIGERALANASRATGRAQRTAANNRGQQQGRPSGARGDTAPPATGRNANTPEARARRLEGQNI